MARPLVFISHSANGDKAALAEVKRVYAHLEKQGFEVLLDRERLDGGDRWRECLHVWMAHCHGAVLLLTKKALESQWVRKEATILAWRRSVDPRFVLLPVLSGVDSLRDVDRIQDLEPLALAEIQMLKRLKGTKLTAKLAELLEPLHARHTWTPARALEEKIASQLQNVRPALLDAAAAELGVDLGGWDPQRDSAGKVALALLQAHPSRLAQSIRLLAGVLSRAQLVAIVHMLSGVWIERELAGSFAVVARGPLKERVAALNAAVPTFTPRCLLARASAAFPPWQEFAITISGEDVVGSIIAQVRATFERLNPTWTKQDVEDELQQLGENEPGVIVIAPTDPLIGDDELTKLVDRFPAWTILVLTGDKSIDVARSGAMRRIAPQFPPSAEAQARKHFREIESVVSRSGETR